MIVDSKFEYDVSDRSRAARILGTYILVASVVLGVFGLSAVALFRLSLTDFSGWYYVFLGAVVAAYLLYQRLAD
jgi:hypothetical protein